MEFNLLDQNVLLIICVIVTAVYAYAIMSFVRPRGPIRSSKKARRELKQFRIRKAKELVALSAATLLASPIVEAVVARLVGSSLPSILIVMFLPGIFGVGIFLLFVLTKTRLRILAGCMGAVSLLFSLLLINSYYRFYPTIGQVFNKNNVAPLDGTHNNVVLQFDPLSHAAFDNKSIEGSLNSLAQQPTRGNVYSLNIPSAVSKFHARTAYVYIPAIYSNPSHINLPVIVLTAGFPGIPENWIGSGLQSTMDEFAKHHNGITPLVFMADNTGSITNDTECVDSPRGNVETYLTTDVPNYIKSNFEVSKDPAQWAIGGLSLGGLCSIMLTLRHPNVYHYFLDFGGEYAPEVGTPAETIKALFHGSFSDWQSHQPAYLLATQPYKDKKLGGFFAVGEQDVRVVTDAASQLSAASQKAGIETVYEKLNGQHTFDIWQAAFKLGLPWVSNRIGATQCGVACF